MANVIIGIHGLGNKPAKHVLEKWWKKSIVEGLKVNGYKHVMPKFELVYWADILYDEPLNVHEKEPNNPLYIREKYINGSEDFPIEKHNYKRIIKGFLALQLNKIFLNDDLSLNYSFLSDAIIGKYFRDLELYYSEHSETGDTNSPKVKYLIRERLYNILLKYKNDNIMLISHSMGSIVAFDVLTFLSKKIKIHTFITMGSPLGLPIIISKIAAEQKQRHCENSHMHTPRTVTNNWFNFSDILDKIAFNFKLSNDFSENKLGVKPTDFLVTNNYEIDGERNPHKSFGYLRTPEFAKVLNEYILTEKLIVVKRVIRITHNVLRRLRVRKAKTIAEQMPEM